MSSEEVSVIINMVRQADLRVANRIDNKGARRRDVIRGLKAEAEKSQYEVKSFLRKSGAKKIHSLWIKNAVAATVPADLVNAIAGLPGVESVVLDAVVSAPIVQAGTPSAADWNIDRINAPALWAAGIAGSGVVVANLDTGVFKDHPDLVGSYRGGTNSWYNPFADPLNASQCASPGICTPCELSILPCDERGHGTGTMGVMVGGSSGIGVTSDASWIAAKVFNSSGNTHNSIIHEAFQWLLDPDDNPATDDAPDIVNASWGFDNVGLCDNEFEPDIAVLKTAGIAVVFAAGNSGPNPATSVSPANNPGAFAVGATDINNNIASFSSRGPSACDGSVFPHVVAPGVNIRLANNLGGYDTSSSGTSFSAPHVSGAMALLLSAFPSLTTAGMETALQQTAVNIGPPGSVPNDTYGYGLIDVSAALTYLTTHGYIAIPEMPGFPAAFDYGYVETDVQSSETFTVTNRSGSDLAVNSITITGADAADFTIPILSDNCSGMILPAFGSCTFTVTVQSAVAGPKNAALNINYGSTPADQSVPLSCTVVIPDSIGRFQENTRVATYSVIQSAYNNCISNDVIRLWSMTYYESPEFNSALAIDVSLQGGYDAEFGIQSGFTTIKGTLTISIGAVTISNIILE